MEKDSKSKENNPINKKRINYQIKEPKEDFRLYINNLNKEEIEVYIKFDLCELFPKNSLIINLLENENKKKKILDNLTKNSISDSNPDKILKFEFLLFPDIKIQLFLTKTKTFPRQKNFELTGNLITEILNPSQINQNSSITLKIRGFLENNPDRLFQKKVKIPLYQKKTKIIFSTTKPQKPSKPQKALIELKFQFQNIHLQKKKLANGLINHGVTCYMNSYLQTIFHIKKFRNFIQKIPNENSEFIKNLQILFYMMEKVKGVPLKTDELIKSFGWNFAQILTQQDVQEFSFMFLDAIEKICKNLEIEDLSKKLFEGKMENFIKCVFIDFESKREEVFSDVQLVVKDKKNIYESLDFFFMKDFLEGDNAYDTEIHGKQNAEKGVRFKELPPVLTFQLNRMEYDYERNEDFKIKDRFEFFERINLDKYVESKEPGEEQKSNDNSNNNTKNGHNNINNNQNHNKNPSQKKINPKTPKKPVQLYNYKLYAIYVHLGHHSGAGHYKVYIKPSKTWLEFDDEIVSPVTFSEIKSFSFGGKQKEIFLDKKNFNLKEKMKESIGHAYMLVYIKESEFLEIFDYKPFFFENIVKKSEERIKVLEKEFYKENHFKVYFLDFWSLEKKESFLGGIFSKRFLNDCDFIKRFKKGKFDKMEFDFSDSKSYILKQIEEKFFLKDKIYSFFYFCDETECFKKLYFENFDFGEYNKHYLYLDIKKDNVEIFGKEIILVFKFFYEDENILRIGDIKVDDNMMKLDEFKKKMNLQNFFFFCGKKK